MNVNGTLLINYGGPLVNYQMSAGEIITGIAIILLGKCMVRSAATP